MWIWKKNEEPQKQFNCEMSIRCHLRNAACNAFGTELLQLLTAAMLLSKVMAMSEMFEETDETGPCYKMNSSSRRARLLFYESLLSSTNTINRLKTYQEENKTNYLY